jgi:hypothetical protein
MNWDALGAIGEIVGATAVVVTLGYLAVQIRAGTRATQSASRSEITRDYRQMMGLMLDSETAEAYRLGLHKYPNGMDAGMRLKFYVMITQEALNFQAVFAQHENQQLEDETYQAYLTWFASLVCTPGVAAWWSIEGRSTYTARMVAAVESRLEHGDLLELLNWPAFAQSD